MARPKSPEKRNAILQAAVREIAESGLGASTARIAKAAGLAEGTIFRYFATKDDLLNELYMELKADVFERILADFPHEAGLRERTRHIWTEYLQWAMESPASRKVSALLHLSMVISEKTRSSVDAERGPVARTMKELGERGAFREMPPRFATAAMVAMQEAVMELAARKARQRTVLIEQAFEAFWRMAK